MSKLKRRYIIILAVILLIGIGAYKCVREFVIAKRLHRAIIKKEGIELDWFFYSLIGNGTPDYITATNEGIIDTILVSRLVKDVYIKKDTIFIELYDKPSPENLNVNIPHQIFDYHIKVDSTEKVRPTRNVPSFIDEETPD